MKFYIVMTGRGDETKIGDTRVQGLPSALDTSGRREGCIALVPLFGTLAAAEEHQARTAQPRFTPQIIEIDTATGAVRSVSGGA